MSRVSAACFLLSSSQVLLVACGAGAPSPRTAANAPEKPAVVVITPEPTEADAADLRGSTLLSPAPRPPSAAERAAPYLERARTLYRDLAFAESLAAVGEAQRILERSPRTGDDYGRLHTALVYRAMNELALENVHRAREALRSAAALRPDAELDEGRFPPAIRAQHREVRSILRAEQPVAIRITTEPPGARIALDGDAYATSPATVHASPARHFLRIEALGHEPRVVSVDFGRREDEPVHVALPRAEPERVAAQVSELDDEALGALSEPERAVLAEALDTERLVTVHPGDGDGHWRARLLDLRTGEAATATARASTPAEALRMLLGQLRPPQAPPASERSSVWASPWLWTGVGAAVVTAGVVGAILLTREPGHQVLVDADP